MPAAELPAAVREKHTVPMVALVTDFGLDDPYVGQLKVVLAAAAPGVAIIDLTHGVRPHDVAQAAFFCRASAPFLPEGAVLLCVVDPGVGSARRLALLRWQGRLLLAPDNGLLGFFAALGQHVGPPCEVWDVTPPEPPATATFHGRDVLAPLAARLANGEKPETLGRPVDTASLVRLEWADPFVSGSLVTARVLHADRFGNLVLNLAVDVWAARLLAPLRLTCRQGLLAVEVLRASCYADLPPGAVGLLAGSQGFLELAVREGSAAVTLGLGVGAEVMLEFPYP